MTYVITDQCELHGECIEVCPVDAISVGDDKYYIDPDLCIDCGTCAGVCPAEAIYPEDEVPA